MQFLFLLSVSAQHTSTRLASSPDRGHAPGATFSFYPRRSALAASFLTAPTIPASLSSRLINTSPCIHENRLDRCSPTVPPPRCLQFHTHSVESRQKEPVCEETSRQAAFPRSTPSCKQAGGRFGHTQTGLVWSCERCRKRNLSPG